MRYLNDEMIDELGVDWHAAADVIDGAALLLGRKDYAQPIKPYLRYGDPKNRIIAMPAYVGGEVDTAGIKWVASFPGNLEQGLQRAHSLTVLNEAATGRPLAVLNAARISGIRTAAVSASVLRRYMARSGMPEKWQVGIVGYGPIGRLHLRMIAELLGERLGQAVLYDIRGIEHEHLPEPLRERTMIAGSWQEAYADADLFVTCTVSSEGYIDLPPKPGSLLLNVSLRDFKPDILEHTRSILVDDWEEVCREGTDIERMHLERGLKAEDTIPISELADPQTMASLPPEEAVMFNPMGMAVFDIAMAAHYYRLAEERGVGLTLPD
ncbi:2,3-diaminopropionate biosynthesis protein SbnB [Paenibacillus sp. 1P07SE]|uniref:2,3-diaminopropionate biosynthesis protein SbnB n=1 Tax=Paenibacillus sp. 1P07SE TaxID=3132209 RepID=UPI0039A70CA5